MAPVHRPFCGRVVLSMRRPHAAVCAAASTYERQAEDEHGEHDGRTEAQQKVAHQIPPIRHMVPVGARHRPAPYADRTQCARAHAAVGVFVPGATATNFITLFPTGSVIGGQLSTGNWTAMNQSMCTSENIGGSSTQYDAKQTSASVMWLPSRKNKH